MKMLFHLFLVFVSLQCVAYAFGAQIKCMEEERQALLNFKREIGNELLASWGSDKENQEECCKWERVYCDNRTGNVIKLDLRGPFSSAEYGASLLLSGNISSSLLELKYLEYLDLSNNYFGENIPSFFGSLRRLKYLNLSSAGFSGTIPQELRNLSSLQTLDLSSHTYSVDNLEWLDLSSHSLSVDNLGWLLPLQSLRILRLKYISLNKATDWLKSVSNLPLLRVLDLSGCDLPPATPSLVNSINSSTSLAVLDLSLDNLDSSIFTWLFNYSHSLTDIYLSRNSLGGPIPDDFAKMVSLVHLDISHNKMEGGVPSYFGNYSNLKSLLLRNNSFSGHVSELLRNLSWRASSTLENLNLGENLISDPLPDTIVEFSSLKYLSLGSNKLSGPIPQAYGELPNLEVLDFQDNEISGVVPEFSLSSSLRELYLDKNQLSGTVTESIGHLSNLEKLYLGSNYFEGVMSESHLLNLSRLQELDLSYNSRLEFNFQSNWIPPFQLELLNLQNCTIGPHIPKWLQTQKKVYSVDISAARISGGIPSWFWDQLPGLVVLNLSCNSLNGTLPDLHTKVNGLSMLELSSNDLEGPVPRFPKLVNSVNLSKNRFSWNTTSFCNYSSWYFYYLDLSDNQLSGHLPDCWNNFPVLLYLNLANNRLSGKFPPSMGSLRHIRTLQLRNNSFTGELPQSWTSFENLALFDVANNGLSGSVPPWVGSYLPMVVVLDLSSNNFSGNIPENMCNLSMLQVLVLSKNKISGTIPNCIDNLAAMTQKGSSVRSIGGTLMAPAGRSKSPFYYNAEQVLMWKGIESKYKSTLGLVKYIDLSSNNLTGDIPLEITKLVGLVGLNLSRNHFHGILTPQIGNLQSLDVLDLSRNQLYGEIPSSLSQMGQLGVLNLSYNDFTGRIPPNKQEASAFVGNPGLCGEPLKPCPGDVTPQSPKSNGGSQVPDEEEYEDKLITKGFYLSGVLGFIFGFWGVCGVLFFNRSSRHSFFRALNKMEDWVLTTTALKLAKLQRWFQG